MNAQRVGVMALRRAATKPTMFSPQVARALAVRSGLVMHTRPITTEKMTLAQGDTMLAQQRLRRPVSPHLEIYDPKQIWFGASIMQRYTGMIFGGLLYGGSLTYLAAPLLGWHVESPSLIAFAAGLPVVLKGAFKLALAFPFAFHLFNGIRHLFWDATFGFARSQIAASTNAVWAASVLASIGLLFV